ncbi:LysM domain protein [Apiospora phragmitis]|uniref:LysM domain protein n=1 Tax=Apiospora phragmitis TaxID=2905665 RepID=A0ABR1VD94_9PEZI
MAPILNFGAIGLLLAILSVGNVQGQSSDTTNTPDDDYSSTSTMTVTSTPFTTVTSVITIFPFSAAGASLGSVDNSDSFSESSTTESVSIVMSTSAPLPDIPAPPASCDAASLYTVKKGDTCNAIARAHGTTPNEILQANPQMSNDCDLVYIDQVICLPTGTATAAGATDPTDSSSPVQVTSATTSEQPLASTTSTGASSSGSSNINSVIDNCTLIHTVVAGDTCHDFWIKYFLSEANFLALNPRLSIKADGYCGVAVGDMVCVAGSKGGDPQHPESPPELEPYQGTN